MTKNEALKEAVIRYGKSAGVMRDSSIDPNYRFAIGLHGPGNRVALLGNGSSWEAAFISADLGFERFKKLVTTKTGKVILP